MCVADLRRVTHVLGCDHGRGVLSWETVTEMRDWGLVVVVLCVRACGLPRRIELGGS